MTVVIMFHVHIFVFSCLKKKLVSFSLFLCVSLFVHLKCEVFSLCIYFCFIIIRTEQAVPGTYSVSGNCPQFLLIFLSSETEKEQKKKTHIKTENKNENENERNV